MVIRSSVTDDGTPLNGWGRLERLPLRVQSSRPATAVSRLLVAQITRAFLVEDDLRSDVGELPCHGHVDREASGLSEESPGSPMVHHMTRL